jgi:hypothetical protein
MHCPKSSLAGSETESRSWLDATIALPSGATRRSSSQLTISCKLLDETASRGRFDGSIFDRQNRRPGDTIPLGGRTLRVVEVRDGADVAV